MSIRVESLHIAIKASIPVLHFSLKFFYMHYLAAFIT